MTMRHIVRARQRVITGILPHQGNSRVLVPKRGGFMGGTPDPVFKYLDFENAVSGFAFTPDSPAAAGNPVLDLRVALSVPVWPLASGQVICDKENLSPTKAWQAYINFSSFNCRISWDGIQSAETWSDGSKSPAPTVPFGIRFYRNGADGNISVQYWNGAGWSPFGTQPGTAGNIFDNTDPLRIGADALGASFFKGRIYRATLFDASVLPLVDMNPADWVSGTSWVSALTGETWNLVGGLAVAG
jgi:hypothetical protein